MIRYTYYLEHCKQSKLCIEETELQYRSNLDCDITVVWCLVHILHINMRICLARI